MTGGPLVAFTQANVADVVARKQAPMSYIVWYDGTNYHADSMKGGSDFTDTSSPSNPTVPIQSAITSA